MAQLSAAWPSFGLHRSAHARTPLPLFPSLHTGPTYQTCLPPFLPRLAGDGVLAIGGSRTRWATGPGLEGVQTRPRHAPFHLPHAARLQNPKPNPSFSPFPICVRALTATLQSTVPVLQRHRRRISELRRTPPHP